MRQAVVDTTTLSTHRRPEPNLPLCVIPVGALFSPFLIYQPISQSIRPSVSPLKDIEGRRLNPTTPCQPKIDLPKHAHTKRRHAPARQNTHGRGGPIRNVASDRRKTAHSCRQVVHVALALFLGKPFSIPFSIAPPRPDW